MPPAVNEIVALAVFPSAEHTIATIVESIPEAANWADASDVEDPVNVEIQSQKGDSHQAH